MNSRSKIVSAAEDSSFTESPHIIRTLPILVIFPHNRCNCRCLMCDIWKIRQTREITARDLAHHVESLRILKVKWVVFSGGEPLLHSDLTGLSQLLRREGIRLTLLTAGLLLETSASTVAAIVDDIIVSLDGPPEVHDEIRGVHGAFSRLASGIAAVRKIRSAIGVSARCTIQSANFRHLRDTVKVARQLGLNSISFLAADVTSEAFNRPQVWSSQRQADVALNALEVEDLAEEIETLLEEFGEEIRSGFIAENAEKLGRIVRHFRVRLGQVPLESPRCNAPWVSAVVEADGTLRPCFFHRSVGNLHDGLLHEILNGSEATEFRRTLDVSANPVCQRCVCPLFIPPRSQAV